MRKSGASTIVGLGIASILFCAVMSTYYLQHLPNKADLERLEADLRQEFGLHLDSMSAMPMKLVANDQAEDKRLGVEIICTMRPDLRRRPSTVSLYLDRIAAAVLDHPEWRGRISYCSVAHAAPLRVKRVRTAEPGKRP